MSISVFDTLGTLGESDGQTLLQVFGAKPGTLGETGEHPRSYLVTIVEREDDIWPAWPGESSVRTGLTFLCPANPQEGGQHPNPESPRCSATRSCSSERDAQEVSPGLSML
jgi:hypothetical protein